MSGEGVRGSASSLSAGGEMSGLVLKKDWSATPLGPIETWPQSLRTTVSLCLASNFPINIIWGPDHIQIYNDGYRVLCGEAHPTALGQDYTVTWASAWPAIGEPFARALAGETMYLENQRMFLTRNGYLEETFFTFSTSPIRDESGGIGGMFHPVTETTATMLAERRTRAVRDLTAELATVHELDELVSRSRRTLSAYAFDLPFVLLYACDEKAGAYRLAAQSGIEAGTTASPLTLGIDVEAPWPVAAAARGDARLHVTGIAPILDGLACGPYDEPPARAMVIPVTAQGADRAPLIMVIGVSPRLPLDDAYLGFYELVGAAMAAALASVRARADERRRAEALAEIDRAKTAFFSNVSHEFRTPLTLMLGPLEDALDDAGRLSPDQRDRLGVAHRNALRLLKLVNTLLDFSRIEAGRTQARFEPSDLAAMTTDLASNFRSACERAGLSLVVSCPPLSRPVPVDRDMWEKIVLNLMSNAFKFTLEGGITVSLSESDDAVTLRVSDTGVGIPADELPRVFERFHRIEGQRGRTHEGTGIGLSLVQELVALHGGTITAESAEGRGTTFELRIGPGRAPPEGRGAASPRRLTSTAVRADAFVAEAMRWLPDVAEGRTAADARREGKAAGMRPRIVLADDNADMRAYVQGILESGGYDVVATGNGAAALDAARRHPVPDLVLSDVMMPEMGGFELLAAIRGEPALKGMLVILLSARAGEEARLEGLAAGADDYLVKPFGARELRARVDGAVRLARQRQGAAAREQTLQTELATAESRAALRETAQQLELAIRAGRLGSWTLDLATNDLVTSAICRETFGRDPERPFSYDDLLAVVHPDDRSRRQHAIARAIGAHDDLDIEYRVERPDGRIAWVLIRGRAEYGPDGAPLRMSGVSLDITDRKRADERQRLLLDELNHRVKNTLATVQSIVMQTRRIAASPEAFGASLEARVAALARAHDLLNLTSWEGAQLRDVVVDTLGPYAPEGTDGPHVHVSGPAIRLNPNAAVTLTLAFHELATNAARYGALSQPGGHVSVVWSVDRTEEPGTIDIDWKERGGPPVRVPSRRGFGSRLLEQGLARELDGNVVLTFDPQGLRCRMHLRSSAKMEVIS